MGNRWLWVAIVEWTSCFFTHDKFNDKTCGALNRGRGLACNWAAVPRHLPKTGLTVP